MNSLIMIFERMKNGEDVENVAINIFGNDSSKYEKIFEPYFEEGKYTLDSLMNVFYYFYTHENMDFYPVETYTKEVEFLHDRYSVLETKILDFLNLFRKVIHEEW